MSLPPPILTPRERLIDLFDTNKPLKEILELIDSENFDIDEILFKKTGSTVLSLAAYYGRLDAVKALVKRGAKLDEQNIKAALMGNELGTAIYLLKINKAEYVKNMGLLIEALPNKTKEEQANITRIKAIEDPQEREREVIKGLIKSGQYINISQSRIIKKFQKFLEIQREKNPGAYPNLEAFIKSFSNGFCNGEVFLWLYLSEHGAEEPFWNELKHFLLWSEDKADLEQTNEKGEKWETVFNQMLANILGMHEPGGYYQLPLEQADFDKSIALHAKSGDIVFDSLFSIMMTKEELLIFLPELVQNELMIGMGNLHHRVGYLKAKFLDPNHPDGVQIVDSPEKLINEIDKAFPTPSGAFSPITLHRFAKVGSKPSYATKEDEIKAKRDFLNRLYDYRKEKGATNDQINYRSPDGATLLYLASTVGDIETARWCVEKGANIELATTIIDKDTNKTHLWTPLATAANHGMVDVVRLLLDSGANLFPQGTTQPFTLAFNNNKIEVVKLIIEHLKNLDKQNQNHLPAPSHVKELFGVVNGLTLLHHCIPKENMDMFDVLMENGADINLGKLSPIVYAVSQGTPDVVRRILKYKDKIDSKDLNLALYYAIRHNKYVMLEALLKAGIAADDPLIRTAITLGADDKTLKILSAYDFKRRFSNALESTPPPDFKSIMHFIEEGLTEGFPPFPDLIPPEQAGSYLRTAIDRFSFRPGAYPVIEFILNNSKFDLNSPMKDLKMEDSPKLPLELAICNAIDDYDEEHEKTIERVKQLISLFMKRGLELNQQKTQQFARDNDAPDELVECIREAIEEENRRRKAADEPGPILSRIRAQIPSPMPAHAEPHAVPHPEQNPPSPATPKPELVLHAAQRARVESDSERKFEQAEEASKKEKPKK